MKEGEVSDILLENQKSNIEINVSENKPKKSSNQSIFIEFEPNDIVKYGIAISPVTGELSIKMPEKVKNDFKNFLQSHDLDQEKYLGKFSGNNNNQTYEELLVLKEFITRQIKEKNSKKCCTSLLFFQIFSVIILLAYVGFFSFILLFGRGDVVSLCFTDNFISVICSIFSLVLFISRPACIMKCLKYLLILGFILLLIWKIVLIACSLEKSEEELMVIDCFKLPFEFIVGIFLVHYYKIHSKDIRLSKVESNILIPMESK